MTSLFEPFTYEYMRNAILLASLTGAVCAFLSAFVMLKGWSLIGDALSHSIVPGVAGAYMLGLPFAAGAFLSGGLAAAAIIAVNRRTRLKEDAIMGIIFTAFFGLGLFMVSRNPVAVNLEAIVLGNILAIAPADALQLLIISTVTMAVLLFKWKDLVVAFFDPDHARNVGIDPDRMRVLFFALLAASTVAALQTVGGFLVIAMIVTPGATAYLLTDRFGRLIALAVLIGTATCFFGAWASWFLNGATGGVIVVLQTLVFLAAFIFAPRHGLIAAKRRGRMTRLGRKKGNLTGSPASIDGPAP